MFSWCFKRQSADIDIYHQTPKARHSLGTFSQNTRLGTIVPSVTHEAVGISKTLQQMQEECLESHNSYREKHGVQPLTLDKAMNAYASEWAKQLANSNSLHHRKNSKYGENLYLGTGIGPQAHMVAVDSWYSEIENYDYKKPGFSPSNGHFTQIIWKTSTKLGVGIETRDNRTWVVCNYDPPGNIVGNYKQCVNPLVQETVAKIIEHMKPAKFKIKSVKLEKRSGMKLWSDFQLECLESHNKYRAMHGCPPMELDIDLCDVAFEWSQHLSERSSMAHRPNSEYGENIYYSVNKDPKAEDCVKSWYEEIQYYNFSKPGFSLQTGHFTQVVWRDSVKLGVGLTKHNNRAIVVCNYSPPGNVMDEYEQQVPRPGEKPTTSKTVQKECKTDEQECFEQDCLDKHNDLRAIHGSPAMVINKNLSFFAKDWAKHLAKNNKVEPRVNNRFGENIFCAHGIEVKGQDPVESWYSAIKDYKFNRPQYTEAAGSFTQVIWKSSNQLGVGVAKVGKTTYVVCNYNPKGNIADKFDENVFPVGGQVFLLRRTHVEPSEVDQFAQDILKRHNTYRAKHGCPPLKLSKDLMDYCYSQADQLVQNVTSSDPPKYSINFVTFRGFIPTANEIVDGWYNEIKKYDFEKPGYSHETKHFTQMIWKRSKFLGVAFIVDFMQCIAVFSYEPAGNVESEFGENVPIEI